MSKLYLVYLQTSFIRVYFWQIVLLYNHYVLWDINFVDFIGQQKKELKCQPILIKYSSYNGSQLNPWNLCAQENVFNGRTTKFDALES